MSDLISRKALLEEVERIGTRNMLWKHIHRLITNAQAIEQGEAVYLVKGSCGWVITFKESYDCTDDNSKRILYTTPQQPQSVADALEEAADVISRTLNTMWRSHTPREGAKIISDLQKMLKAIRALIKRNEVNHG